MVDKKWGGTPGQRLARSDCLTQASDRPGQLPGRLDLPELPNAGLAKTLPAICEPGAYPWVMYSSTSAAWATALGLPVQRQTVHTSGSCARCTKPVAAAYQPKCHALIQIRSFCLHEPQALHALLPAACPLQRLHK